MGTGSSCGRGLQAWGNWSVRLRDTAPDDALCRCKTEQRTAYVAAVGTQVRGQVFNVHMVHMLPLLDIVECLAAPDPAFIHPVPRGVYPFPAADPLLLVSCDLYTSYADGPFPGKAEKGDGDAE
jgi:hypothetical protein